MKEIKVAAVQAAGPLFQSAGALEKIEHFARRAAENGARLIVFPEAFIGGYPKGSHFGAPVGSRSDDGRDLFRRYWEAAIEIPGAEVARLAALAGDLKCDLVIGAIERAGRDEGGGTLYCASLVFSADGRFCGRRRKLMPTAAERIVWGCGDGSTLDAFDVSAGRLGTAICWENFMPMMRMSQYAQGVELYCAPTVDDRESWTALMRVIALEGRCFVISANQFMRRADAPADFHPVQGEEPKTVMINGGSVIVSPLGEILAGPVFGEETILYAQLDPADIARGKMDFDVAGHYARADVFKLKVNREGRSPLANDD
ncbi:carbon-nitrogen hydrolase family protein [Hyphococcus sp.]|uniref:carbon-nitrogen hydrolase family protein n=1 Tax=Hyphococcus sp. TaxID=2038636 RepID=UPI0035C78056